MKMKMNKPGPAAEGSVSDPLPTLYWGAYLHITVSIQPIPFHRLSWGVIVTEEQLDKGQPILGEMVGEINQP